MESCHAECSGKRIMMTVKLSIVRVILLGVTLLFAPLYTYNMVNASMSLNHESYGNSELTSAHFTTNNHSTSQNQDVNHCSLDNGHSKCNHLAGDKCSTTCCVNFVLITSSVQELTSIQSHIDYYNTFRQLAESSSIDNQFRPPQFT